MEEILQNIALQNDSRLNDEHCNLTEEEELVAEDNSPEVIETNKLLAEEVESETKDWCRWCKSTACTCYEDTLE